MLKQRNGMNVSYLCIFFFFLSIFLYNNNRKKLSLLSILVHSRSSFYKKGILFRAYNFASSPKTPASQFKTAIFTTTCPAAAIPPASKTCWDEMSYWKLFCSCCAFFYNLVVLFPSLFSPSAPLATLSVLSSSILVFSRWTDDDDDEH